MNKIKLALIATAILAGIGGAFATRPCDQCESHPQYVPSGMGYVDAGRHGIEYYCFNGGGICTYWKPDPLSQPNSYAPCRLGLYVTE
jgi:hypothetical protein